MKRFIYKNRKKKQGGKEWRNETKETKSNEWTSKETRDGDEVTIHKK